MNDYLIACSSRKKNVFQQKIDKIFRLLNNASFGTFWIPIGLLLESHCTMGQDAAITFRNINTVYFSTSRMHSKIQRKIIFSPFTMLKMNFKSAIFGPLQESE